MFSRCSFGTSFSSGLICTQLGSEWVWVCVKRVSVFSVCHGQLENLTLLVEQQQQGSGLRDRAAFLVLTRTLLLGLDELSETQHLLTAQRVYVLLERALLEVMGSDAAQVGQTSTR